LKKQFPGQLWHIPVWINKGEKLGRHEWTQRTRSFLFSALGTLVAQSIQAGGVRFYENGIVSVNLPIAEEVLRARASRTTHPLALHLLSTLCSEVTERDFVVDNPYQFKTKTEVVETLAPHHASHLIRDTCSCSRSMFQSKTQRHCGHCSQCIDRRFATVAAGLTAEDLEADYVSDVFVGERRRPLERAMAVDYTRHGIELQERSEDELAAVYNAELSRAVRYAAYRSEDAQEIIAMHKRHGQVVTQVLEQKVKENASKLVAGTLEPTSLLALVIGQNRISRSSQQISNGEVDSRSTEVPSPVSMEKLTASDFGMLFDTLKALIAKSGGQAQSPQEKLANLPTHAPPLTENTFLQEVGVGRRGMIADDPRKETLYEAVIKKVQNPDKFRHLSIREAALYFEVQPRSIFRWTRKGDLSSGARRGSITIDSALKFEKKRARKRRDQ
jgi:hypothetical protein